MSRPAPVADARPAAVVPALEAHHRELMSTWGEARGGRVDDRPDMLRFVSGFPVSFTNGVVAARLSEADADRLVAQSAALFREAGVPATWIVGPLTTPADLGRRLARHGFRLREAMPWMAAAIERIDLDPPLPAGLRVERVAGKGGHDRWLVAMSRGFGLDPDVHRVLDQTGSSAAGEPDGPWVRFVGAMDGRVVASSGLMLYGGLAGVYNVATVPDARRRGIGAAMTRVALLHARDLGYRVAVMGASEMGMSIYEGMGFREVCREEHWVIEPPRRR